MSTTSRGTVQLQRGFSLVELMVAMGLSLVLLAGALSILYSSKLTYSENDRIARLQEAGRTVVELMLRDSRPAGFLGCSRPVFGDEFSNDLNNPSGLMYDFASPMVGFDTDVDGTVWSPALDNTLTPGALAGSDVLLLRTTRQGQPIFRTNTEVNSLSTTAVVDRSVGQTVPVGTQMVITDCEGATVFQVTGFTEDTPTTATITHAAGGVPGNASDVLTRDFQIGAQVMPVETIIYYVRNSVSGSGPALWQKVGSAAPQELIDGVENLQIRYGVDTDANLLVNDYVTADLVTDWNNVVAITVAVLVRSPDETGVERDNRKYNLLDQVLGPFNDRRQRSVFTTTVVLRNRTS